MSEDSTGKDLPERLKILPKSGEDTYLEIAQHLEDTGELNDVDRLALSHLANSFLISKRLASTINKGKLRGIIQEVGKNHHKQVSVEYQIWCKEREFQMKTLKDMKIGQYSKQVLKKKVTKTDADANDDAKVVTMPQAGDAPKSPSDLRGNRPY